MNERDEVIEILKEHGAVLDRQRKHQVWRFSDGRIWVMPSTASDQRSFKNNLSNLRRFLGLNTDTRGQIGIRREKKSKANHKVAARAVLSAGRLTQLSDMREVMMTVVRRSKPKVECCYPMEKRTMLRSQLTVILGRLFA